MQGGNQEFFRILNVPIAATDPKSAIMKICSWVEDGHRGKMVTFTNVHMLVEASRDASFAAILEQSDINCPDGVPLVWLGKYFRRAKVQRTCGPEFMMRFFKMTRHQGIRHFIFGGAPGVAESAARNLREMDPLIQIVGTLSPPFREITPMEEDLMIEVINSAEPDVVWVALGCPKQEKWIAKYRNRLNVKVLLAVGLAIDIVAGTKKRAPEFLQKIGAEWLYRLYQEPKRLWRRYLIYNAVVIWKLMRRPLSQ